MSADPYEELRNPRILSILTGNERFGRYIFSDYFEAVEISMPRMDLQYLYSICERYKIDTNDVSYSMWYGPEFGYLDCILARCVKKGRCPELLAYLFGKPYLTMTFRPHDEKSTKDAYEKFRDTILGAINGILWTVDCHLTCVEGGYFVTDNSHFRPETSEIKVVDSDYIRKVANDAISDIEHGRLDVAVTLSRTLLEEVYQKMIEVKGETPDGSGKINMLFEQVKRLYFTNRDGKLDKLLDGHKEVQDAIAGLRNDNSSSHGVGAKRKALDEHYVRLYVNSSLSLAEFMLGVMKSSGAE